MGANSHIYITETLHRVTSPRYVVYRSLKIKIYRTIILPVVLYGCETWSLTLREERRLRVFENRVLRGVFGPKRDEVTGEWRKMHNEELNDLYSLPNIVLYPSPLLVENLSWMSFSGGKGVCTLVKTWRKGLLSLM